MVDDPVATLRRFNRSWTQRVGVLDDSFLGSGRPLGPSRLLFELTEDGTSVRELRERLGLDSGYMSRLLRQLEAEGLVTVGADPADARRRVVSLTADGRAARRDLDDRSEALARGLVDGLSVRQRAALADHLESADRLVRAATVVMEVVDPGSKAAWAAVEAYLRELDETFEEGFDPSEAAGDRTALGGDNGRFVLARSDGTVVGCGGLQHLPDGAAEIKRMWVHPDWRGLGIAGRLLRRLEDEAAGLGHDVVRLDTNRALTPAIAMYRAAGYAEIGRYNDNPYAHHWFEKRLR
jgi:DNA-binding MarR family transcriptional regulator